MGSFSDEINDEKQSSIVTDHENSTQISDLEKMRITIASLPDETARAICEARLASLEEHIALAERAYAIAEARYVDQHVKPFPELEPDYMRDTRTYEQRVDAARKDFAQTERGLELQSTCDERGDRLWQNLERFVESFTPVTSLNEPSKDHTRDTPETARETHRLSPVFHTITRP